MADVPVLAPAAEDAAPAGKSKKTLIIVMVLAVLLLAGGGVGAWFAFAPHGNKKHQAAKQEPPAPALYVALDPPFVVNFEADQQVRFLQVTAQLMTRDPATIELLKTNDPVVRNDLLHAVRQPEVCGRLHARGQGGAAHRRRSPRSARSSRAPAASPKRSRRCTSPAS